MLQVTSTTVLASSDLSLSCDTGINYVVGFIFPTGMVSTSAELFGSVDNANFYPMKDAFGNVASLQFLGDEIVFIAPFQAYATPRFIKLKFSDTETVTKTVTVLTREI
jgi:hypothetical protein